jgi:hypothetical protein
MFKSLALPEGLEGSEIVGATAYRLVEFPAGRRIGRLSVKLVDHVSLIVIQNKKVVGEF